MYGPAPSGVRRLVAALEIAFWPGNGSLLPFSGETNAWLQAHRGNPGSKLPVWGSTRPLKSATSRRTPNAPWVPCVKNYAALGGTPALLRRTSLRGRYLWYSPPPSTNMSPHVRLRFSCAEPPATGCVSASGGATRKGSAVPTASCSRHSLSRARKWVPAVGRDQRPLQLRNRSMMEASVLGWNTVLVPAGRRDPLACPHPADIWGGVLI